MRRIASPLFTLAALAAVAPRAGAAQESLVNVRLVAADTLRDVAYTTLVGDRPVIYYNPAMMEAVGERLRAFFIAHEYGHVAHGHPGGALTASGDALARLRQQLELEADCYAASRLLASDPDAVDAAIAFFSRMGPFRYDQLHPTGAQRAANLLACTARARAADGPAISAP